MHVQDYVGKRPPCQKKKMDFVNLSNLFPPGDVPQLKQIHSTLNIAGYIAPRYSRRWGSNPRISNQLCSEMGLDQSTSIGHNGVA